MGLKTATLRRDVHALLDQYTRLKDPGIAEAIEMMEKQIIRIVDAIEELAAENKPPLGSGSSRY